MYIYVYVCVYIRMCVYIRLYAGKVYLLACCQSESEECSYFSDMESSSSRVKPLITYARKYSGNVSRFIAMLSRGRSTQTNVSAVPRIRLGLFLRVITIAEIILWRNNDISNYILHSL